MPAEDIYRPQVMPRAGAAMPGGNANAGIGALGGNIAALGDTLHRDAVRQYTIERQQTADREQADFTRRFAQLRVDMDARSRDSRSSAGPGGQGHMQSMAEAMDEARGTLFEGITEQRILDQAQAQFDDYAGRFHSNEANWEEGQRIAKTVSDFEQFTNISANRARSNHEPDVYADELRTGFEAIDAMSVPPDVKDQLKQRHEQTVASAFLQGVIDTNPQVAMGMIQAGMFNDRLTPQQIDGAMNGAHVEIRRAEARVEAETAAAKAQARAQIEQAQRQLNDGVPLPDDQMEQMQVLAQQYGLEGDAYDIGKARIRSRLNRQYQSATPAQIERDLRSMDAEVARAGNAATPDQIVARDHLGALLTARRSQIDSDPAAFGASLGISYGPVTSGDAASVRSRVTAATATAQATGRAPVFLMPNELAELQSGMASAAGRTAAIAMVQQFRGVDPRAAGMVARQIAPNDGVFQHAALLRGPVSNDVMEGRALIAGRTFTPPRGLDAAILNAAGSATSFMTAEMRTNMLGAARALYAKYASVGHDVQSSELDPRLVGQVVRLSSGAERRNGEWVGGIGAYNGRTVRLPDGVSEQRFAQRMARIPAATTLYTRDGRSISRATLLASYTPVRQSNGAYAFVDGSGGYAVLNDKHTPGALRLFP